MRKLIVFVAAIVFLLSVASAPVLAKNSNIDCPQRFATIINPVRSRDLWFDKSLKPIEDQEKAVKDNGLTATWLVQNDVLFDPQLLNEIKTADWADEKGVFMEVSLKLANQAGVYYPTNTPWFYPNAVFLSGYSESDRKRLIDAVFNNFRQSFGYYPKSVGAWWIDSYSLNYMKQKYGITAAMIVADQKTTDSYGVWGQWWGVPYYPSKANILTPAGSVGDKQDVVVLQWAQRDPKLAFGVGPKVSNYSLQANDYIRQGKDTNYFKEVAGVYLDCHNPIGQITVGLETGQESIDYINEYLNQMGYLKSANINTVTMSGFADKYAGVYPSFPTNEQVSYQGSVWELSSKKRDNKLLGDLIVYQPSSAFVDYFLPDREQFLNRDLSTKQNGKNHYFFQYFLIVFLGFAVFSFKRKGWDVFLVSSLFSLLCFGLILRSDFQYGFEVFYGTDVRFLQIVQCLVVGLPFVFFMVLKRRIKDLTVFLMILLSFGFDSIAYAGRFSNISGQRILGILIDPFHFIGIGFKSPANITIINRVLENYQAQALLDLNFQKLSADWRFEFLINPLVHIILGVILASIMVKLPQKVRLLTIAVLILLSVNFLVTLLNADPRLVQLLT